MRIATRTIKDILLFEYPECQISVRFVPARQYVDGSDKLVVMVRGATYSDVHTTLMHYTRGVRIFHKHDVASCGGICRPEALDVKTRQWIDMDLCEFIELEAIPNE